jgi:hypothetical protein
MRNSHVFAGCRETASNTGGVVDRDEVEAAYAAYDEQPLDEPDEWGDLASFREAAAAS